MAFAYKFIWLYRLIIVFCFTTIFYLSSQEHDLRYLVDKVWGGQSILSAWDDLFDLTLVRWDKNEEWSPWNCILLTKDEAATHEKLVNLEEVSPLQLCLNPLPYDAAFWCTKDIWL